jgi:hypothetical protein
MEAEWALDVACTAFQVASLLLSALENAEPAALGLEGLPKCHFEADGSPHPFSYSRLVLGEFEDLREFGSDVELVFANTTRFNPVVRPIHAKVVQAQDAFFRELSAVFPS